MLLLQHLLATQKSYHSGENDKSQSHTGKGNLASLHQELVSAARYLRCL